MSKEVKILTERDYKKKWQTVYTLTPADLRFLLIGIGIEKENIEMAHINRGGHEWLDVTIKTDDGWVSVPFDADLEEEKE